MAQGMMTHLVSLVGQGVFEEYPDLRVLMIGGGLAWIPSLLWRFDAMYVAARPDVPWLTKPPSEYVAANVRFGTYPLSSPAEPERLLRLLASYPGLQQMLCFASGFPDWDCDSPSDLQTRVPAAWLPDVFSSNAQALFRW
jgi:predicted TIM-barrel fold metal-dependent hydrolase